ncbi:MAG TPA: VCBS repeat-containing protein [Candidatus Limnocylindrales bacterium]|jgi:hypothetical protein|nr:VCBS repeat-containing protein [Candidatus Limnocylindrales bacterium]
MDPKETGIWFTNVLQGEAYATNAVAHNGAGVAIGDVDGDGWQDIYLCTLQGRNRLYRNLGNWHFEEIDPGEAACLGQFSTGATFADVDGDGDLDLLVNGIAAGTRLFLNDGKGRFTELKDSGLSRSASATSLALADIDGDGDLDLYCTHYIDEMHLFDPTTRFSLMKRDGRWVVLKVNDQLTTLPRLKDRFEALPDGRVRELPEVDGLYRNDGHGHFTAIQFEPGVFSDEEGKPIPPFRDWGLSAMFRDLNGDGAPDLYVCNDNVSPDRIWINSGKGTFRLIDPLSFRHTSRSSMGIDFADIDRDGHDDLIVVDMLAREHSKRMTQLVKDVPDPNERERVDARPQYNRNTLFFGRGDGTYAEAALMAGVAATDWSWCPIFLDVDLDGYEDLLISNGFESDVMDQDRKDELRNPQHRLTQKELRRTLELYPRWHTANAAFRNRHDGTFEPMSQQWGFDQIGTSQGMALGDLDNDGDMDLVVNNLNQVVSLYRNNAAAGRIAVRLKGLPPNNQGIGARIRLVGGAITQSQEMICGGRYLSGDQAMRVFAADPDSSKPMRLEVKWRNGTLSTITNVQANRIYEVDQSGAVAEASIATNKNTEPKPFFKDVSSLVGHVHQEDALDDWSQQPSLPRRLSRLGPGVAWYDVDGDGWEDLILAAAKGGKLAVYRNEKGLGFHRLEGAPVADSDQGAVLGWSDATGKRSLFVAVSNFGMKSESDSELAIYSPTNLAAPRLLSAGKASLGPIALADIDGDGDLDLFVGGRFRPGRYPEPVSSSLWLNDHDEFRVSPPGTQPFESIGLVSGATFADLDGDGWPDLALALEWGPVRVFRNNHGKFEEMTSEWKFGGGTGWWTSITAGDFDGDGRLDLAVGNWGRNSSYELHAGQKLGVFYGDWNQDGKTALIEAWEGETNWFPVHNRAWLATTLPELANHFLTHQAFARATIPDILGTHFPKAQKLETTELRSGIFLNRGSHFEWVPFPREAQLAPVFSVNVGDFDGDGIEDLFLSQNFFSAVPENTAQEAFSRDDSGRGLWLRGRGDGTFTAIDGNVIGIKVYGEQRGAALADFNHDGRIDVVVSQNNGSTRLFVNERAKRGLRVTLHGEPGNRDAVGAQIRLRYADGRLGPCRSISAGTGYWSQDATTQVLGCAEPPIGLWIRWPGGTEQVVPLEKDLWDVNVEFRTDSK